MPRQPDLSAPIPSGYMLPLEREVAERVVWIIRLRWVFVAATGAIAMLVGPVLGVDLPLVPVMFVVCAAFVLNVAFTFAARRLPDASRPGALAVGRRFVVVQMLADWAAIFLLATMSGGALSPVVGAFLFHVVVGSLVFSRAGSFRLVAVVPALHAGLAVLTYYHLTWSSPWPGEIQARLVRGEVLAGAVMFFGGAVWATALLSSSVAASLRGREGDLVVLERQLRDAFDRSESLAQLTRTTASSLDLSEILRLLTERVVTALGVKACMVRLLDEDGRHLHLAAARGLAPRFLAAFGDDIASSPLSSEVLSGRAVAILDAADDDRFPFRAVVSDARVSSVLAVPIEHAQGRLGVVYVFTAKPHAFADEEIAYVRTIADTCSLAIANARAFDRFSRLDQERSTFVRTVTHELRAPIAVVESIIRLFLDGYAGKLSARQRELMERAEKRARVLRDLVNDLLDLAAGSASAMRHVTRSRFDLRDLVSAVVGGLKERAQGCGVELGLTLPVWEVPVVANDSMIERAVGNVVENGVKYTPSGGRVEVELSTSGRDAVLVVRDTGIGIPSEALPKVGTEFFRATNAKNHAAAGTGLGVAIVKRVVEGHAGTVSYQSAEGKGTTVAIRLPLAE